VDTKKSEVLQGTLDLTILKTPHGLGPLYGFGIARRIEQLREEVLQLNEGTVYTSAATPAAWMDGFGVGHVGKQPLSQVLLHHQAWTETVGDGDGKLGTDLRRSRPCAEDCRAGVTPCSGA
jgi:hypothetical protein